MATLYIVKTTIHAIPKKGGKKVIIKASKEPQAVPAEFVKELLASKSIEEAGSDGKAAKSTPSPSPAPTPSSADDGGSGDDDDKDKDKDA